MRGAFRPTPEARRDLIDIFRFIARKGGLRSAYGFLTSAEATFQRLATVPNLGTAFMPDEPRFAGLRYGPVGRFKSYVIFYRPTPEGIEVLRVLHGSRDLEGLLTPDDEAADDD